MAEFPEKIAAQLLADCQRRCCLCSRWCGRRMQIHHIDPQAEGGSGAYDNGIPVCLDCHAEIESRSNMGRKFTPMELKLRRDRWFAVVKDRPEVLLRASRSQSETGPLEALLAELDFNLIAVSGPPDEGYPPLATTQFDRAIANNALASLDRITCESIQRAYVLMHRINYHFEELARMDRYGGKGGSFGATQDARNNLRDQLKQSLPTVISNLKVALGQAAVGQSHE